MVILVEVVLPPDKRLKLDFIVSDQSGAVALNFAQNIGNLDRQGGRAFVLLCRDIVDQKVDVVSADHGNDRADPFGGLGKGFLAGFLLGSPHVLLNFTRRCHDEIKDFVKKCEKSPFDQFIVKSGDRRVLDTVQGRIVNNWEIDVGLQLGADILDGRQSLTFIRKR